MQRVTTQLICQNDEKSIKPFFLREIAVCGQYTSNGETYESNRNMNDMYASIQFIIHNFLLHVTYSLGNVISGCKLVEIIVNDQLYEYFPGYMKL